MEQGRIEEAVYSDRAAELYERLGDLWNQAEVISNSGADAFELGDWDRALKLLEKALELKRRMGDEGEVAIGAANIAEIYLEQGRLSDADDVLTEAARTTRAGGYRPPLAYILGLLGRAAAGSGRFDEARAHFDEARSIFEEVGVRAYVFLIQVRTAELYVQMGDPDRALQEAEEAFATAAELDGTPAQLPLLHRIRAYAQMQLGNFTAAREELEQSLAAARTRKKPHEIAMALTAGSQLDQLELGEPNLAAEREAQEILARLGVVSLPPLPVVASTQPATA
jgi:tetratricopeptide (TPR) repeat protein